jgi:ATP-dependent Clp protease ATP-binding subunit ClpA
MSSQTIGFGDPKKDSEFKGQKAIEKIFSPEFRNRLDDIITFKPLTPEIMERIVDKFIQELNDQLASKKASVSLSSAARRWLARKGHDPQYGARPLTRLMQTEIKDPLSDEILFGKLEKGGQVLIDVVEDKLEFHMAEDELELQYS